MQVKCSLVLYLAWLPCHVCVQMRPEYWVAEGIVAIQWVTTDFYKNIQRYTSLPIKLTILVLGLASRQLLFLSEHHDLDLHTKCDLVAGIRDTNKGSNKHVKHSPLPRRPYKLHNTVCASFTAISDLALFPGWMPWQLLWVQTVTSAARK